MSSVKRILVLGGGFAGHIVVCDLFGLPMLALHIPWYVTVLDLGAWGAVYTEGWNRHVVTKGAAAKKTKQVINCQRIYPPLTRNRQEILAAAAPVVQHRPRAIISRTIDTFETDGSVNAKQIAITGASYTSGEPRRRGRQPVTSKGQSNPVIALTSRSAVEKLWVWVARSSAIPLNLCPIFD